MMTVRIGPEASRGLRWCAFAVAAVTIFSGFANPADARRRHHHQRHAAAHHAATHHAAAHAYNPPSASIVVDANTGAVLEQSNADSLRHPASLTKVMTLYLLFEQLEAGRLSLNTALPVSEHASIQSPTKLGLRPGQTISVENAIKGIVTRSANDAAVVIAEAIGGSEAGFARMMTQKAHALGMSRTAYVNASGLPDDRQITTARDLALLGRAIQERFPRYYHYFSTPSFVFRGHEIRNHNHLLGSVEGVDGIKTGYTRDSGFNLLTSMWRGRRHLVAVVLGGRSWASRDAHMRQLLAANIDEASPVRTASVFNRSPRQVAEDADAGAAMAAKPLTLHKLDKVAAAEETAAIPAKAFEAKVYDRKALRAAARPGSTEPIKPLLVKTVSITPPPRPTRGARKFAAVEPPSRPAAAHVHSGKAADGAGDHAAAQKPAHSGWMIQVGAFDAERDARRRLSSVRSHAKRLLGEADPFTEPVTKGDKTIYRARFAGLDKHQAEAACRALKRNEIACLALKN